LLLAIVVIAAAGCSFVRRASVSSPPATEATVASSAPSLSRGGRWVAFASADAHLVRGDTNGVSDVFVHDNVTGSTERISTTSGGAQATGASTDPSMSDDGRYVAFTSTAPDLAPDGADNGAPDVFVKDRRTGAVTVASLGEVGTAANQPTAAPASHPVISGDGRSVAFTTARTRTAIDAPPLPPIPFGPYVRDLDAGVTRLMPGPGLANFLVVTEYDLSDDGCRIIYQEVDVGGFYRGATHVADVPTATDLGSVETHTAGQTSPFPPSVVALSGDGSRFAVVANPTTEGWAFLRAGHVADLAHPDLAKVVRISTALFLSTDGTTLGWGTTTNAGVPVIRIRRPGSGDDVVVTKTADGTRTVAATEAAMSADGRFVAFVSSDPGLVPDDHNGVADVFTRGIDPGAGTPSG
jgi:hypothetical protein